MLRKMRLYSSLFLSIVLMVSIDNIYLRGVRLVNLLELNSSLKKRLLYNLIFLTIC